jgi:hypothetical protein
MTTTIPLWWMIAMIVINAIGWGTAAHYWEMSRK